jgi:hypothetical protein
VALLWHCLIWIYILYHAQTGITVEHCGTAWSPGIGIDLNATPQFIVDDITWKPRFIRVALSEARAM